VLAKDDELAAATVLVFEFLGRLDTLARKQRSKLLPLAVHPARPHLFGQPLQPPKGDQLGFEFDDSAGGSGLVSNGLLQSFQFRLGVSS